jgi:phosphate transport system substrate-binding protein
VKDGFAEEVAAACTATTGRSVRVVGGGCDDGIRALENGRAHLAGICCEHAPNTLVGDLKMITVADDLKVVLTHPANPVENIRFADLRAVCRGDIRNWRELGGPDRTIALVVFDHCLNYVEPVRQRLFRNRPEWSPAALIAKTDDSLLQSIARFEWSIGINSWVLARSLAAAGKLKTLSLDGIPPERDGVLSPTYPLTGDLALAFAHWDTEMMRPFFDFVFSAAGRAIVAKRTLPRTAAEAGYNLKIPG